MSKYEPKNREEAFAYQLADDVKLLKFISVFDKKEFQAVLETLKTHISAYEQLSQSKK